jgi:ABC-type branched-subunit amino acid transport system ATPase component
VSLSVGPGEIVTLLGANGSGKSTTLRAISRLVRPARGRIRLDGRDITRAPADATVAAGRELMTRPRLVLLDEPSLGLAPMLAREIFRTIQRINATGVATR